MDLPKYFLKVILQWRNLSFTKFIFWKDKTLHNIPYYKDWEFWNLIFTLVNYHPRLLEVICDTWHVTTDTRHLTYDLWHVSHDTQGVMHCANFSSLALLVWLWRCLEYSELKDHWLTELINHKAVCWTAPASPAPGLLKTGENTAVKLQGKQLRITSGYQESFGFPT